MDIINRIKPLVEELAFKKLENDEPLYTSNLIVSLFFKNKMENAGLSLGKNRHLKKGKTSQSRLRSPAPPKGGAFLLSVKTA